MSLLLLKLLLVPALVMLITLVGRRWGPAVAGWLAGFPVVAGPTLLFIALDQGGGFAASAALATLTAVVANVSFLLAYAWVALRCPWYGAAAAGLVAFALVVWILLQLDLPLPAALALTVLGLLVASRCFPVSAPLPPRLAASAWELPARCLLAGGLSLGVIQLAEHLGPHSSGMMTAFPVLGLVLGVFSQISWGGAGSATLLAGMVRGLYAFTAFCSVLAAMLAPAGIGPAFLAALSAALLMQLMTLASSRARTSTR